MYTFSIKKALNFALQIFAKNYIKIFLFTAAAIAFEMVLITSIVVLFNVFIPNAAANPQLKPVLTSLIYYALPFFIYVIYFFMLTAGLKSLYNGNEFEIKKCFPPVKIFFKFIGGIIILAFPMLIAILAVLGITSEPVTVFFNENGYLSVMILLPFLFLATGIAIAVMLARYVFYYLELFDGYSLSDSFRKSALLTVSVRKKLVLTLLVLGFFSFAGYAYFPLSLTSFSNTLSTLLILIMILTLPISALLMIHIYNELGEIKAKNEAQL